MHSHIFLPALPPHVAILVPGPPPVQFPQPPPTRVAAAASTTAHPTAVESDSKRPPACADPAARPPHVLFPVTHFPGNVIFIARALTQPQTLQRDFRRLERNPTKSVVVARAIKRKYTRRVQRAEREKFCADAQSTATPLHTLATLAIATTPTAEPRCEFQAQPTTTTETTETQRRTS